MKVLPLLGCAWLGLMSPEAAAEKWVTPYNFTDLDWYTIETEHFAFPIKIKVQEGNDHYLTAGILLVALPSLRKKLVRYVR